MLELRHLHAFIAIAEERHFGKAARRLRVAQPALSQQLQRMEALLSVKLFKRTSRNVELTEAGAALLPNARALLADAARAETLTKRAALGEVGSIRMAFIASGAFAILPDILSRFRKAFPDVAIEFYDGPLEAPIDRLENGSLDVAIVRDPEPDHRVRARTLLKERICAVLPTTHPLAGRKRIDVSALAEDNFVMFPRLRAPRLFDKLVGLCDQAGFAPRIVSEAAEWQVLASLVAANVGVTLAPESVRRMPREGVSYVALTSNERLANLTLLYSVDRVTPVTTAFIQIARDAVAASRVDGGHPRSSLSKR